MTAWGDTAVLIELLDRQFAYVWTLQGTVRLVRLRRLLSQIEADPRLAGLLQDYRTEALEVLQENEATDVAIRDRVRHLGMEYERELGALVQQPAAVTASNELRDLLESGLGMTSPVDFPRYYMATSRENETGGLLRALRAWSKRVEHAFGPPSNACEQLRLLGEQLGRVEQVHEYASQRLHEANQSLPWPAFCRLIEHAHASNPSPPNWDDAAAWARFEPHRRFAEVLRTWAGDGRVLPEDEMDVDAVVEFVEADTHILHEELRRGLALGRTRLGLVRRYCAMCEWFEAERLRGHCKENSRNAERHLTLHFAKYLFDQGLSPLIDPTIGGLKPDILHVGHGEHLYVEAKQYAGDSPKSLLVNAYSQVWSTWSRLRKHHPVVEAFVVVFRRSGPFVELPALVRHNGLKLHSMLADISEEAGSREKSKAVRITEADLVSADEDTK